MALSCILHPAGELKQQQVFFTWLRAYSLQGHRVAFSIFFRTLFKVYVSAQVSRYSGIQWQGTVLWGPGVEIRVDP